MDFAALIPTKQYRYYFECLSKEEAAVYDAMLSGLPIIQKRLYATGAQYLKFRRFITF